MTDSPIAAGLSFVFGVMTVVFAVLGVASNLFFLFVALLFGAVTYLTWYHASGRMVQRIYASVESRAEPTDSGRGGFGAGPREEWTPPRDGQRASATAGGRASSQRQRRTTQARNQRQRRQRQQAYDVLGVDPGASEDTVKSAYRERVKDAHPDTEGGSEDEFKRVNEAYETLTE